MSTGQTIFATVVGGVLVVIIVALLGLDTIKLSDFTQSGGPVAEAPATTAAPVVDAACIISVTNSLATYFEEPGLNELQVGKVPTGRYGVSDIRVVDFAGKKNRWFYIAANGQPGWILDETFFVESKEGTCR